MRGHDDNRQRWIDDARLLEQLEPRLPRHSDIGYQNIGLASAKCLQGMLGGLETAGGGAMLPQSPFENPPVGGIVIDYPDTKCCLGHVRAIPSRMAGPHLKSAGYRCWFRLIEPSEARVKTVLRNGIAGCYSHICNKNNGLDGIVSHPQRGSLTCGDCPHAFAGPH